MANNIIHQSGENTQNIFNDNNLMKYDFEHSENNKTFFSWAFPFGSKYEEIEISPFYVFGVDNLSYDLKIEEIKKSVYSRIEKLGFSIDKPLEMVEIPYKDPTNTFRHYYWVINKVNLPFPGFSFSDFLTNDNFLLPTFYLHPNFSSILPRFGEKNEYNYGVLYNYEKNKFKYCVFEKSTTPKVNYDDIGDFEKDENGKIIEPEVEYETKILFSGITFDIYLNPKNENLEQHIINRIWNCVNGNYEYSLKEFLDFHFTKYTGNTDDFLNYLKEICTKNFNPNIASNVNYFKKVKKWIVSKSEKLNQLPFTDNGNPTTSATVENENLVLFQREIALIYHYENWLLTDENANDEVRKYLQKDGTRHKSGKALMEDYRIVNGEFKDWLNQKVTIKYLKKIIPLLQNTKGINDAKEDLEQAIKNRESLF